MSSIKLTDNFGFSLNATNGGQNANFFKRLLTDAEFVFETANLKQAGMLPLAGDPAPNLPFTLTAKGSAAIGFNGVASLKFSAGCTGKLSKIAGDESTEFLHPFQADFPASADKKAAGYLTFDASADVAVGGTGTFEEFTFGLTKGNTVSLSNSRFFPQLASTKLVDATRSLLSDFVVLDDISDLEFLPTNNICSVAGKGSLKFTADAGYQFFTNPLISTDVPVAGTVAVNACGTADVSFVVTLTAGFKVSALKTGDHTVRLAVERSRIADFDTTLEVSAAVKGTVKSKDILSLLLGCVSPHPEKEIEQMNAKLDDNERDAINTAIKVAIQNNFELAVQAEVENVLKRDSLLLYEVDLTALTDDSKAALQSAFHGDFTKMRTAAGITEMRSVFTTTRTKERSLTVHMLNVFQAGSVAALISRETINTTPAGDLVITDSATARKTGFLSFPAQTDGLRKVLFTSAMITSTYTALNGKLGAPDSTCELVHFEYDKSAPVDTLKRCLNALQMLRVVSSDDATAAVTKAQKQKPAPLTINISLKLTSDDCGRLFLEGSNQRTADEYETAAKAAMLELMGDDPAQKDLAAVLKPENTAFWNKLKNADTLQAVAEVLGDASDRIRAAPYFAEVSRIKWWTEHMAALSSCVAALRAAGSTLDTNNPTFQKLHQQFKAEAQQVSSLTEDYFNLPWGVLAVSQVLSFSPKAAVMFVSQPFSVNTSTPAAVQAGAAT